MKAFLAWSVVIAIIASAIYYFSLPLIAFPVLWFIAFLASGGPTFPKVFFRTFLRDMRLILKFGAVVNQTHAYCKKPHNISDVLQKTVSKYPHKTAFQFEGENWTFKQVDEFSNQVGNFFKARGFGKGDVVALFMENRPEYVCLWLGLAKIGVITALINFNLRLDSLYHCVSASEAKALLFSSETSAFIKDIVNKLDDIMEFYSYGYDSAPDHGIKCINLNPYLKDASKEHPIIDYVKSFDDILLYIYTSGTTGLPKPAIIRTSRFFLASGFGNVFNVKSNDIMYCTLPLYHSAGGMIGVSCCFVLGCTLVIRRKFSASRFWDDCIEHKVTVIQYIGELCRYLLAQPPCPSDTQHTIQVAIGNGLRPKIWPEFQSRFKIKQIGEFYGASEGNVGFVNVDNTVGACGFISLIFSSLDPTRFIRVDLKTGEIVRGRDGLAIDCKPGEPGLAIGKVVKDDPGKRFDGYLKQSDTEKKLIRNVFVKGDMYFMSGDVLVRDEYGYVFFVDRIGDSFRWRGENVSTVEVETIVSKVVGSHNVVAYGVEVPGVEGKAGMVIIADPQNSFDIKNLAGKLSVVLPSYACPVFVRLVKEVAITGTFKFQKTKLKEEGFDVTRVKDPMYYLDRKSKTYLPLEFDSYHLILNGSIAM